MADFLPAGARADSNEGCEASKTGIRLKQKQKQNHSQIGSDEQTRELTCGGPALDSMIRNTRQNVSGNTASMSSVGASRLSNSWTITNDKVSSLGASDDIYQLMSSIAEQPGKGMMPQGSVGWNVVAAGATGATGATVPKVQQPTSSSCGAVFGIPSFRKFCSILTNDDASSREPTSRVWGGSSGYGLGSLPKAVSGFDNTIKKPIFGSNWLSDTAATTPSAESASPGLFSPHTQSNWMNLSVVGEESSSSSDSCTSVEWTSALGTTLGHDHAEQDSDLETPNVGCFGSMQISGDMTPTLNDRGHSRGHIECSQHILETEGEVVNDVCCETPVVETPSVDQPCRNNSGRRTSGKATSVRGPRTLMKPPPIHRSKLYQRRLQHRGAKSLNSKRDLDIFSDSEQEPARSLSSGAEHKLATFKMQTLGLKPVVC